MFANSLSLLQLLPHIIFSPKRLPLCFVSFLLILYLFDFVVSFNKKKKNQLCFVCFCRLY